MWFCRICVLSSSTSALSSSFQVCQPSTSTCCDTRIWIWSWDDVTLCVRSRRWEFASLFTFFISFPSSSSSIAQRWGKENILSSAAAHFLFFIKNCCCSISQLKRSDNDVADDSDENFHSTRMRIKRKTKLESSHNFHSGAALRAKTKLFMGKFSEFSTLQSTRSMKKLKAWKVYAWKKYEKLTRRSHLIISTHSHHLVIVVRAEKVFPPELSNISSRSEHRNCIFLKFSMRLKNLICIWNLA